MNKALTGAVIRFLPLIPLLFLASLVFLSGTRGEVKLKAEGSSLCFSCHEKLKEKSQLANVHLPFKQGNCTGCHNPHTARFPKLLAKKGGELCYSCHQDKKGRFTAALAHRPVMQGECTSCHQSHASPIK